MHAGEAAFVAALLASTMCLGPAPCFGQLQLQDPREFNYDLEKARVGLLQCEQPVTGRYVRPPYPVPDWETYSRLDKQTDAIYDVVRKNPKEMHIQNLRSEGLVVDNATYGTDLELVVYERGGLSSDTLGAIESIGGDEVVLDWLRNNNQSDWSTGNDRARAIPRKRPVDGKVRVVFIFGEHAREAVTTEVAEYMIKLLSEASLETLLPVFNNDRQFVEDVLRALDNTVIHIIPCENKQGRRIVETDDPNNGKDGLKEDPNMCKRTNGRIVDPNRNWPLKGGVKSVKFKKDTEEGTGPTPLSEPESRALFRIYSSVEPQAVVNFHSGMHGMFMPIDYNPIMVNSAPILAQLKLQKLLNDRWMEGKSTIGGGGSAVGYVAWGTHNDFVRRGFGISSTQTWEIYGNERAAYYDCWGLFNPDGAENLGNYVRNWTGMALEHITHLHKGLVPGIRSPDNEFSEEVASMPIPSACGLTQSHIDAMNGLDDIALGRGDRVERLAFVEEAMRTTPVLEMPTLDDLKKFEELSSPPVPEVASGEGSPEEVKIKVPSVAERQEEKKAKPFVVRETNPAPLEVVEDIKRKVEIRRKVPSASSSVMLGSYSTMLFGISFLMLAFLVYRRYSLRRHGGRHRSGRQRRYRVWDVV